MKSLRVIRECLGLLSMRDRKILYAIGILQMAASLLDLLGILVIGVVAAVSIAAVSGQPFPSILDRLPLLDSLAESDPLRVALGLSVAAAVVLMLKSLLNVTLTKKSLRFLANRQAAVSGKLASSLLSQPLLEVQRRSSQQTTYILTAGVAFATLIILGQGLVAFAELALLAILTLGLLAIDPVLTIFTVIFFSALALALHKLLSGWATRLGSQVTNAEVESAALVQEALKGYREITVSSRRDTYVTRFTDLRLQAASVQADIQFVGLIPKYVFEVALVIGAGLLAASQFILKDEVAAVTTIAVFLAAGSRVLPSLLRLQGALISIQTASTQAAPTLELAMEISLGETGSRNLQLTPRPIEPNESLENEITPSFVPRISLKEVSITYPGVEEPALQQVSFYIESGQSLALVGSTGAGKSTLADVILGVVSPDSGEVLLSGVPPSIAVDRWPGEIAYVPQDVAISNGTIRENVALGLRAESIDDNRVFEALERAHLAKFLAGERSGLETVVGEHGVLLSGGQRQRLGLARALYSHPKLLVLDEATSALDAETEQAISETLTVMESGVTKVTVAHRLATIRDADVIIFLKEGRIAAMGDFSEVRRKSPDFERQARLLGL